MIRTQLKLFSEETKKNTKTTIVRLSSSLHFKGWNETIGLITKNFSTSDRKYYAGMTDGDAHISSRTLKNRPNARLLIQLELRHDHAEPILKLAELFDLTISKRVRLDKKNTQPSLRIEFGGIKAKIFLFSIYPYLLEKKEKAGAVLISFGCPEKHLPRERQFSFEYLAGYTDAEGTITFRLSHDKMKSGNTTSYYQMRYELTNNDNAHLQFLKKSLIDLGFNHFTKDYLNTYKNIKKRKGTNPEKWKPTTHILLGGGPARLSSFYKNIEPFILIKHKKDNMLATIKYNDIITMNK